MIRALLVALAACGTSHPCDDRKTCIELDVSSDTIAKIDQLEVDILYDDVHATLTTHDGTQVTTLPLETAIAVPSLAAPTHLGVVVAGKLSGATLGTAAGQVDIDPLAHLQIGLVLAPPSEVCTAGGFYCGGHKLAGDPDVVYTCNDSGVPLARGFCKFTCTGMPGHDDYCIGGGGTCIEGSRYCGGDKVDGDPQSLYTCSGGKGTLLMRCANQCAIVTNDDDMCR